MAYQLSPGVTWSEIDLTTIVPSVSSTVGAFAGEFDWGPINTVWTLSNEDDLVKYFHKPSEGTYRDWFTCANFLAYANSLRVVRAANTQSALNATSGGEGLLIQNQDHYVDEYMDLSASDTFGLFAARFAGALGNSLKVSMFASSDKEDFLAWEYHEEFDGPPGTSVYAKGKKGRNDELHIIVIDEEGKFSGVPGTILEKFPYLSKALDATNFDGSSNYYVNVLNQRSNYIYAINKPMRQEATLTSVTVANGGIGFWAANNVPVTGGHGEGALVNVVTNSVGTVTRIDVANTGSGFFLEDASALFIDLTEGANAEFELITDANNNVASIVISNGGVNYANGTNVAISGGEGTGLVVDITSNATGGITNVSIVAIGEGYANNDIVHPILTEPDRADFIYDLTGEEVETNWGMPAANMTFSQSDVAYTSSMEGGENGFTEEGHIMAAYDKFASPEDVDISLMMLGAHTSTVTRYVLSQIVGGSAEGGNETAGRRDCVAFLSPQFNDAVNNVGDEAKDIVAYRNSLNISSSYGVMDSAWKKQFDKYSNKYRWVPLNGDIAGLCARTDFERDPWWSPAGFNRGQIKNVVSLSWNPRKNQRDDLYTNGINPVVSFKGEGTVLYGDKTMLAKPSAFDRINVRRLFIVLEKAISRAAKYSLFEFNDEFTRAQFVALIEPYLRDVKGRRGIYDFRVVCDETNNTPEVIDRNEFKGDIYIKPARSINFIHLNFVAVRTGVAFSEIVGKFG